MLSYFLKWHFTLKTFISCVEQLYQDSEGHRPCVDVVFICKTFIKSNTNHVPTYDFQQNIAEDFLSEELADV